MMVWDFEGRIDEARAMLDGDIINLRRGDEPHPYRLAGVYLKTQELRDSLHRYRTTLKRLMPREGRWEFEEHSVVLLPHYSLPVVVRRDPSIGRMDV